jgi:hypothetical protein
MSANAFGSDWAHLEAGTFRFRDPLNKERRFIPLRLDDAPIKGSLAQFLYINWHPADREQEYAKLLAACRGEIELSSSNESSALVYPQVNPAVPTKLVHVMHSGSGDIVMGNKTVGRPRVNFTPGPQHITPETARKLYELVKEIVERLTVSGGNVQKAFQRVWGDFNAHFGLTTYKELPCEKADEGISYLRQWRASKNSKLRFADPEKFRTAQLKGIWPRSKSLGMSDTDLYAFVSKKLKLSSVITSLNDLGNQQLARLNRFLLYEERKLKKGRTKTNADTHSPTVSATVTRQPSARSISEETPTNEQTGSVLGWTFQDLPDHQIRAYHRQLCNEYLDLNSFDLLELCGRWRKLAVGFTSEAYASGRHGAHVVHDLSIDAITRLLETACAARGLSNIDRLNRCLRRPDDGHLHYALALLDDLEARLRAEAITKQDVSASEDLEKKPHG